MNDYSMKDLIDNSIRVSPEMITISPLFYYGGIDNIPEIIAKYPGCFAINKATVAYVYGGKLYATPYTRKVIRTLEKNNFAEKNFFVPFSNWEYPITEKNKWELLRKNALKSYHEELIEDCVSYSDAHRIGTISEATLRNSLQMPNEGIEVKGNLYYPIDLSEHNKIGTFAQRRGVVLFIYRDGRTFVTKETRIISELRKAGFRENKSLFVPFSNGEEIRDPSLRAKWESLSAN